MAEWLPIILGAAVTLALGVLTWTSTRKTGDRERITKLEVRVNDVERRDGRKGDYVEDLREHINTGKGPPAPSYPLNYFD